MNGRLFLGNTPTVIAGVDTKMRFGIVTMGDMAHTFHIHGHRWVVQGPEGIHPEDIQTSIQSKSISQFEDTRMMGGANSFNFTIKQGSFMGSIFHPDPAQAPGLGEWHMHCHIPRHMMNGMMGSLLVVSKGQSPELQSGVPYDMHNGGPQPAPTTITINNFKFIAPDGTNVLNVTVLGTEVIFDFQEPNHTVVIDNASNADLFTPINNGGGNHRRGTSCAKTNNTNYNWYHGWRDWISLWYTWTINERHYPYRNADVSFNLFLRNNTKHKRYSLVLDNIELYNHNVTSHDIQNNDEQQYRPPTTARSPDKRLIIQLLLSICFVNLMVMDSWT